MGDHDHDLGIAGIGPGTRIGEGGSAVVYRARQEELDRDIAVKVLGFAANDDTRRRFDRERRLMGRLSQHEGMVTVYDTGFNERGEPYITMPLLGSSLADEIKVEPLSWERAAAIVAEVARTVGAAHDQGIIHRDLKPGNIMMSSSGRPLVADFGIARIVDSNTNLEATSLALTPAYSPPEALATTVAHPTGDVYSLGATLYALIAGHAPYCAGSEPPTLMTLMNSIVNDAVPSLGTNAPPQVQAILERAMAKRPEDRYQSIVELADDLDAVTVATRSSAEAPTVLAATTQTAPQSRSGRTTLLAVGAAIVVVIGLVATVVALSGGGDDDGAAVGPAVSAPATAEAVEGVTEPDATAPPTAAPSTAETTLPVIVVQGGEVFLVPFDESGDDPFTPSIAATADDALLAFVAAGGPPVSAIEAPTADPDVEATSVVGVSGTDDGVFAGSEAVAPCSPDQLLAELGADAPETAAWADVQEIPIDSVGSFIDGLTSVVLTADTRVTDHEFVDGMSRPRQVVLQVGTAVMVDEFGAPRVRCASGSPLAAPEPVEDTTSYVGAAWDTFRTGATVAVVAAPAPVDQFVLTDVAGGPDFIRPVGSSGATDQPLLPGEVLATGSFTSFTGLDQGAIGTNVVELVFRPEGGEVTGSFNYTFTIEGISLESVGDLSGTYDAAAGVITGTGFGTTSGGGVSGSGGGAWTATVDPAAGTIAAVAGDNEATFDLTFTPYAN